MKKELVQYFTHNDDANKNNNKIASIIMQTTNDIGDFVPTDDPQELLFGNNFYYEEILGKKFKVSPSAFLQVNTPQCNKLYSLIG